MKMRLSLAALLAAALLAGCTPAPPAVPEGSPSPTPERPVLSPSPAVPSDTPEPDPVEAALASMTVEEKVGQLLIVGLEGTAPGEDAAAYIQDYQVGGLILFGRNVDSAGQLLELTNGLKALNQGNIPLFLGVDQEGGRVDRMPPEVQRTPSAYQVGSGWDGSQAARDRTAAYGAALSAACASFGFNLDFAPVADVWSDPDNTVIGDRAFGSDPEAVGEQAAAAAQAMLDGGTIPVAKHFPGHGSTATDSHLSLPVVEKTLEDWTAGDFLPFQRYLDGVAVGEVPAPMMVGHILLTALDGDYPASLSQKIVTGFLREGQDYDGVLFTDDLTMGAIAEHYGLGEAAVLAVEAGCDVVLVCHGRENADTARTALLDAVESGRISQRRLDESVRRILTLKTAAGLSDEAVEAPDLDALNAQIGAVLD